MLVIKVVLVAWRRRAALFRSWLGWACRGAEQVGGSSLRRAGRGWRWSRSRAGGLCSSNRLWVPGEAGVALGLGVAGSGWVGRSPGVLTVGPGEPSFARAIDQVHDEDHHPDYHRDHDSGCHDKEDDRGHCDALGSMGERLTCREVAEPGGPWPEDGVELAEGPRSTGNAS